MCNKRLLINRRTKDLTMNKSFIPLLSFIVLIFQLSIIPIAAAAKSIEHLVNQGKLTISLKVNQKEQQIVGQALVIAIEISTDRWFTTGSNIQKFTMTDVVMQANNTTTINGSKHGRHKPMKSLYILLHMVTT